MWEEKEGVMRNAMTTRAPCGANKADTKIKTHKTHNQWVNGFHTNFEIN